MRCLTSCAAVATALRSDFRLGLLWCTLYSAQAGGFAAARALDEAYDNFLQV